ncbi:hypothetical protein CROQUDRAFT_35893 [Cronartium quercuum f. sp. fusiforme G11]|uniref:NADP-dependent oxidoreductase domain-containing protein n=1 Tax=Cronartium quercuum f. sp. fusiforme G11 TaxID=708437 RepID=A0A9P6NR59_9BASI|nr:hypothetical protein CROQUDRAFT_35893 [Cronartium quercuum f. sp. fusiforme G11]
MAFLETPSSSPSSGLKVRRTLGSHSPVKVSPVCLGAYSCGSGWEQCGTGQMSQEDSFRRFDLFVEFGGNFIDTINNDQQGESERRVGQWMKERDNRKELVIATKYTAGYKGEAKASKIDYGQNSVDSASVSIGISLKNLQTSYIDILYVDFWDWTASIEEMMESLDVFVKDGKVLYLGVSDTPAWVVSQANQYARDHGLAPFSVYQGHWSLLLRDFQLEILPMCVSEGMALCPWGEIIPDKSQPHGGRTKRFAEGENSTLYAIAKELGTLSVTAIALAYGLRKFPFIFPIIGERKLEHYHAKITSLSLRLTQDHIKKIEGVSDDQQESSDKVVREISFGCIRS